MSEQVPSWKQRIGFIAVVFGMFMAILDIQIVASSLNEIQAGVSATRDQISWVQTAYLIAEVIMIPLSGMLTRILSTRVAFVLSCAGFTLASVGCALATSLPVLVALRALQGFLGGAMIPIAYAVSFSVFPSRMLGMVQAVMGLVATMAPSIGPTVGGLITQTLSYHWLFFVNVLPGILVSVAVWNTLDIDTGDRRLIRRLDVVGLALMATFLGCLEYVLEEGPGDDWFDSTLIRSLSLVTVVAAVAFFVRVMTVETPIVDLRAFRNRNFAIGAGLGFCVGIALYGLTYLMPRILLAVGLTCVGIGTAMNSTLDSQAMLDTTRDVQFDVHWNALIPHIDTGREVVLERLQSLQLTLTGASPDPQAGAVALLAQRIGTEAQTMAFNDIFLWMGIIYLVAVPLLLFMNPPRAGAGAAQQPRQRALKPPCPSPSETDYSSWRSCRSS